MITSSDIESLIGKPFGNDGFNCYSLAKEVFKYFNIDIPTYDIGDIDPCCSTSVNELIIRFKSHWVEIDKPEIPCIIFIKNDVKLINHVGVCISSTHFLHALKKSGVVLNSLYDPYWVRRFRGYYKYGH